jgi:hypothetical protein
MERIHHEIRRLVEKEKKERGEEHTKVKSSANLSAVKKPPILLKESGVPDLRLYL